MTIASLTRLGVRLLAALALIAASVPGAAWAADFVTRPSVHSAGDTLDRFEAAVRAAGWVVFTRIDHAAAAQTAGQTLPARTVVLFGDPRSGTPAMRTHDTLAIDLPMRVLVWDDGQGHVFVTRATAKRIARTVFAPHGVTIAPDRQKAMDETLGGFVHAATD